MSKNKNSQMVVYLIYKKKWLLSKMASKVFAF